MLGAGGVGKSCLTAQFVQNVWIEAYDPTIEDSYRKQISVDGEFNQADYVLRGTANTISRKSNDTRNVSYTQPFWFVRQLLTTDSLDTAGTEQFTAMRELYMKQGQGFLLVFSITNTNSFHELNELREQIIRIKDDEDIPIVVVGNKSDMEDDRAVGRAAAFQLAHSWGQKPYFETSARRRTNVDEVFHNLCRQIVQKEKSRTQMWEQQIAGRQRQRPNRHDRRKKNRGNRSNCVIL